MSQLREYLRKLAGVGAGELLLSAGRPPLYRAQDGLLPLPGAGSLAENDLRGELQELLTPDEWQELEDHQRVHFQLELDTGLRVRGGCHSAAHGLTVKLTVMGELTHSLADLELPRMVAPVLAAESGLIIVTGPSGSGKTTLLARFLMQLAGERQLYVSSSENPVEYRLEGLGCAIVQRAVGRHCPSHVSAIQSALATEAQVVSCSELTAPGVFGLLVEGACSGAITLGEMRGRGVVAALEHLLATSAADARLRADLAGALSAVISLELLPKKTGGRVWAAELLIGSRNVSTLIRDGNLHMLQPLLDREPGMQSMDRSLLDLATRGIIEGREAYARASDKRALASWA
jgi:twitching motility protein PilT